MLSNPPIHVAVSTLPTNIIILVNPYPPYVGAYPVFVYVVDVRRKAEEMSGPPTIATALNMPIVPIIMLASSAPVRRGEGVY